MGVTCMAWVAGQMLFYFAQTRTHVVHTRASLPRRVIRAWQTESKKKGFYGGGEKGGGGRRGRMRGDKK